MGALLMLDPLAIYADAGTASETKICVFDSLGWKHADGVRRVLNYLKHEAHQRRLFAYGTKTYKVETHNIPVSAHYRRTASHLITECFAGS
jgi:hypothetical protein